MRLTCLSPISFWGRICSGCRQTSGFHHSDRNSGESHSPKFKCCQNTRHCARKFLPIGVFLFVLFVQRFMTAAQIDLAALDERIGNVGLDFQNISVGDD